LDSTTAQVYVAGTVIVMGLEEAMSILWSLRVMLTVSLATNLWFWRARAGLHDEEPEGRRESKVDLVPPSRHGFTPRDEDRPEACAGSLHSLQNRKRILLARIAHDGPLNLAFKYGDPDEAGTRRLQRMVDSLPDSGLGTVASCRVGACRVIVTKPVEQRGAHSLPLIRRATDKMGLTEIAESGRRIVVESLTGKLLVEEEMYLRLK
jgi:hypothetical protein